MKNIDKKLCGRILLRFFLGSLLCIFVFMLINTVFVSVGTERIGYDVYAQDENGETYIVRQYRTADGEDPNPDIEDGQIAVDAYTELPYAADVAMNIITQLATLIVAGAFIYPELWAIGNRDNNSVAFGHMEYDPLRGLKIGLIAGIPYDIFYIALLVCRALGIDILFIYNIVNVVSRPYISAVTGGTGQLMTLSYWQLLAIIPNLFVLPAICWIGYILGYKKFSIREKLTYKSRKDEK